MNEITVRLAMPDDYDAILELQKTRYIHNLDRKERRKGFLSVQMTEDEIHKFAKDLGIVLALDGTVLLGFYCLSSVKHWMNNPIICELVTQFRDKFVENSVMDPVLETCLFGPVCISDTARGRDVYSQLYAFACQVAVRKFDFGISFVSANNLPAITAAKGIGFHPDGQFSVSGRKYYSYFSSLGPLCPSRLPGVMASNS